MTYISGKQKCGRCGKEYEWYGYKMEKGDDIVMGAQMPHHFSDAFKFGNKWTVMVHCDCRHREETNNMAISKN